MDAAFREDCALLGLDPDKLIPPKRQTHTPEDFELWPWFADAWDVFTRCRNQWVWVGGGMAPAVRAALNYSAVGEVMRGMGLSASKCKAAWSAIHILEDEALTVFNSRR